MAINDLIKALRSKTSRDNRELLDEAADVIELLLQSNEALKVPGEGRPYEHSI